MIMDFPFLIPFSKPPPDLYHHGNIFSRIWEFVLISQIQNIILLASWRLQVPPAQKPITHLQKFDLEYNKYVPWGIDLHPN